MREGAGKKQTSNKKHMDFSRSLSDPGCKIYQLSITYLFKSEICLYISVKCTFNVCTHLNTRNMVAPQKNHKSHSFFTF